MFKKKTTKPLSEFNDRELEEEKVTLLQTIAKRQRSIDGSTSFLFWLGLIGLIGTIIYLLFG